MKIILKDGSALEVADGATAYDCAMQISAGLARSALCCGINGKVCDLTAKLSDGDTLTLYTFADEEGKKTFWHTTSHVLAQAVKRLYPSAKLTIGPAVDNGFYYDFYSQTSFTPEILSDIEAEMKKIIKEGYTLERFTLPKDEALKLEADEPYKQELINELPQGEEISFYRQGDFVDLCAGPHLYDLKNIKAIKLTNCTGAYWRGDAKNKMLQRIYGVSFPKASELEEHLARLEEAKKTRPQQTRQRTRHIHHR